MTVVREGDMKMENSQRETVRMEKGTHEPSNIGDLETDAPQECLERKAT